MDEASAETVMSVELAIQRELAYRNKLAKLGSLPTDSMKVLLPLEDPSLSPTGGPILRPKPGPSSTSGLIMSLVLSPSHQWQASSSTPELKDTPKQFPSERPGPSSISCPRLGQFLNTRDKVSTSYPHGPDLGPRPHHIPTPSSFRRSSAIYRPSISGIKRKVATGNHQDLPPRQQKPSQNSYITVDHEGNFFCEVCQVPCSGAINLKQHLEGHKHKAKLQYLQLSKRSGGERVAPQSHCELGQIGCLDESALKLHLKGQKYQAKLQELEFGRKTGREKEAQRQRCELCRIWCTNEDSFQQHLKGKNHISRLSEMTAVKKPQSRRSEV